MPPDFLRLPSPQCKQVIVERTASVGADVEVRTMLLYLTVGLDLIRSVGDVILCQFLDGSEDGVRTACTKHWMI